MTRKPTAAFAEGAQDIERMRDEDPAFADLLTEYEDIEQRLAARDSHPADPESRRRADTLESRRRHVGEQIQKLIDAAHRV